MNLDVYHLILYAKKATIQLFLSIANGSYEALNCDTSRLGRMVVEVRPFPLSFILCFYDMYIYKKFLQSLIFQLLIFTE